MTNPLIWVHIKLENKWEKYVFKQLETNNNEYQNGNIFLNYFSFWTFVNLLTFVVIVVFVVHVVQPGSCVIGQTFTHNINK